MTGTQNKIIKKYKREIRQLFPIFTQNEKRFFNDICSTVSDYAESHKDFTLESLIDEIGDQRISFLVTFWIWMAKYFANPYSAPNSYVLLLEFLFYS